MKKFLAILLCLLLLVTGVSAADTNVELIQLRDEPYEYNIINGMLVIRNYNNQLAAYNEKGEPLWIAAAPPEPYVFYTDTFDRTSLIIEGEKGIIMPAYYDTIACIGYDGKPVWEIEPDIDNSELLQLCTDGNGGAYAIFSSSYIDVPEEDFCGFYIAHITSEGTIANISEIEMGNYWEGLWIGSFNFHNGKLIITGDIDYDVPFIATTDTNGEIINTVYPDTFDNYIFDELNGRLVGFDIAGKYYKFYDTDLNVTHEATTEYVVEELYGLPYGRYAIAESRALFPESDGHLLIYDQNHNLIKDLPVKYGVTSLNIHDDGGITVLSDTIYETFVISYDKNYQEQWKESFQITVEWPLLNDQNVLFCHNPHIKRKDNRKNLGKHPLYYDHDEVFSNL